MQNLSKLISTGSNTVISFYEIESYYIIIVQDQHGECLHIEVQETYGEF
jgi:hypothetical protein